MNINSDFHFSCIPCSGEGLKGQVMPAVTHTVHVPPTNDTAENSAGIGEMVQCNKLFFVTSLGNVQSWQPESLF